MRAEDCLNEWGRFSACSGSGGNAEKDMNKVHVHFAGKVALGAVLALSFAVPSLYAASVSNNDAAQQTIVVTEGVAKREMLIAAGETVEFCDGGCFVTFPNGDREALKGDEKIVISGGKASFQ